MLWNSLPAIIFHTSDLNSIIFNSQHLISFYFDVLSWPGKLVTEHHFCLRVISYCYILLLTHTHTLQTYISRSSSWAVHLTLDYKKSAEFPVLRTNMGKIRVSPAQFPVKRSFPWSSERLQRATLRSRSGSDPVIHRSISSVLLGSPAARLLHPQLLRS